VDVDVVLNVNVNVNSTPDVVLDGLRITSRSTVAFTFKFRSTSMSTPSVYD